MAGGSQEGTANDTHRGSCTGRSSQRQEDLHPKLEGGSQEQQGRHGVGGKRREPNLGSPVNFFSQLMKLGKSGYLFFLVKLC